MDNARAGTLVPAAVPVPERTPFALDALRILLVEDDEGDAFLVRELLEETALPARLEWVRSLAEATATVDDAQVVLLDLGLPDTQGLSGLRALRDLAPQAAILVLTGWADEHRGLEAVASGAQDYLVKGQVDAELLGRSLRYALERRRADESLRRLYESELHAAENARLERGLLATPLIADPGLSCATRYRPGRRRSLLGGDFFDVIEGTDGCLHLLIGDVAGHGPDEAALGVCLRIAWRTLVLAGMPPERILPILDDVLVRERSTDEDFATVCMLTVVPDRSAARLWLAGHPAPLLLPGGPADAARQLPDDLVGPALGVVPGVAWGSVEVPLGPAWRLLLFTDGLVEGRDGASTVPLHRSERLGAEGLLRLIGAHTAPERSDGALIDGLLDAVEELHGGELSDDVAVVLVGVEDTDGSPALPIPR